MLDPRGIFILGDDDQGFIWVGNEVEEALREPFLAKIEQHLDRLQTHEQFPRNVIRMSQGEESNSRKFLTLFSGNSTTGDPPKTFTVDYNRSIDYWYQLEVPTSLGASPRSYGQ